MAKKIELLHTTYDESGNVESQEVVHPLTSPDCIIMENGKTLDEVMGDGIATPTLTHEGTSFKVGVGDSNIEVVDGDVAGMTLKGQSYQNILPKPTTLIMETDEKEFKINDKIDSNIIIDDNIAEIATVKGKTIVNTVQEESDSEYSVLGEDLSGQSIVHVKNVPTLEGQTLVNLCLNNLTLGNIEDDGKDYIEQNYPVGTPYPQHSHGYNTVTLKPNTTYLAIPKYYTDVPDTRSLVRDLTNNNNLTSADVNDRGIVKFTTKDLPCSRIAYYNMIPVKWGTTTSTHEWTSKLSKKIMIIEYQEGMENWDIPYFEGTKTFENNIKGVTLQGQTLVNTIQEPCKNDYVVLGADDGIEISAETGGHGTIEDTVQGGINGAVLEGMTLINLTQDKTLTFATGKTSNYTNIVTEPNYVSVETIANLDSWSIITCDVQLSMLKPNTKYLVKFDECKGHGLHLSIRKKDGTNPITDEQLVTTSSSYIILTTQSTINIDSQVFYVNIPSSTPVGTKIVVSKPRIIEYQEGMENWDIPYFEGMKSVQMPVLKTVGKNLNTGTLVLGKIEDNGEDNEWVSSMCYNPDYIEVISNTEYSIKWTQEKNNMRVFFYDCKRQFIGKSDLIIPSGITFITPSNCKYIRFHTGVAHDGWQDYKIVINKGNIIPTEYEPYQSSTVTTGKLPLTSDMIEQGSFFDSFELNTQTYEYIKVPSTNTDFYATRIRSKATFKVHGGDKYIFNLNTDYAITLGFCKNGLYSAKNGSWITNGTTITIPRDCNEMFFAIKKTSDANIVPSEFSSVGLEIKHLVNLRKVGDVQDELDLTTGKLTQRIGEVVLDGNKEWSSNNLLNNGIMVYMCQSYTNGKIVTDNVVSSTLPFYNLDYLKGLATSDGLPDAFITTTTSTGKINLAFKQPFSDFNQLKQYLSQNPITVQYELATPIIKTIDLQVTDQDGNTIPHIQTQPNITHITASSDYLIPTVTIDNNLAYDTIIKPSTLYTVRFNHDTVNTDNPLTVDLGGTTQTVTSTEFTITTPSELTHNQLVFSGKNNVVSEVQVIEGDVTNIEYPFFEGMSDVKFSDSKFIGRGKNLIHVSKGYGTTSDYNGLTVTRNGADQTITINGTCTSNNTSCELAPFYREFKKGERYAFSCKLISGTADRILFRINDEQWKGNISCGLKATSSNIYETCIKTFYSDETYNRSSIRVDSGATFNNAVFKVMLEKIPVLGDYTPQYEPFKGVVEVQQDVDSIPLTSDMFEQGLFATGSIISGMSLQQMPTSASGARMYSKLIKVKPNTIYSCMNFGSTLGLWYLEFDKNGLYYGERKYKLNNVFQTMHDTEYVSVCIYHVDESAISPSDLDSMNLILQEVPQEIVLRGIGDVKDELDLTRGEYIQRIGEIVLCGADSEQWYEISMVVNGDYVQNNTGFLNHLRLRHGGIASPNILVVDGEEWTSPTRQSIYSGTNLGLTLLSSNLTTLDKAGWCAYLSQNPITVQYELATPIIHKVNLTNAKVIPSYATETHYETITPSDSLIPNITIPSTLNYDVAIKPSTEYTIRANTSDNLTVDLGGATGTLSNGKVTLTTPATLTHNEVKFSGTGKVKELMVVEGNEIKDNVPFFNGMKDVQMGGIKLVNIARVNKCSALVTANANKTQFTYTSNGETAYHAIYFDSSLLKTNTVYTVFADITTNTSDNVQPAKFQFGYASGNILDMTRGFVGKIKQTITSPNTTKDGLAIVFRPCSSGGKVVIENPMIIEGDWTHLDEIPFIESEMIIEQPIIRSQGKNLLDPTTMQAQSYNGNTVTKVARGFNIKTSEQSKGWNDNVLFYIDVEPYTEYTYSFLKNVITDPYANKIEQGGTVQWGVGYCFIKGVQTNDVRMEGSSPNGVRKYFQFNSGNNTKLYIYHNAITDTGCGVGEYELLDFQLEKGHSSSTPYEPYKHQTLYSNRVIGYEEGVHYGGITGIKSFNANFNSVMADVEGLSIAYVTNGSSNFSFWDKDMVFISGKSYLDTSLSSDNKNGFIQVPSNAKYMKFASANTIGHVTDYTKATVTGELPLRSLPNGVCDTLNLVTGEYVQRVGEVVLDGINIKPKWIVQSVTNNITSYFDFEKVFVGAKTGSYTFSDKFIYENYLYNDDRTRYKEGICIGDEGWGSVRIFNSRLETADYNGFVKWLQQNPITVQYELATPIVRKLGFTAKGNYREQVLDGREEWIWNQEGTLKTTERFSLATITDRVCGVDNLWCNTIETINTYNYDAEGLIGSSTFNTIYLRIKKDKCDSSWDGFVKWLSQNPTKISYLTNQQSSESYSNIHKPIFFNNVDVQFLPQNVDIQPELTLQARTKNSYVMDMMKPNTQYSIKLLSFSGGMLIDGKHYALENNRFISPSTLTNKELIITSQWYEPMIIEGDVTAKNLPYFKGILSSYHDVDEIEVYSINKNLFDINEVFAQKTLTKPIIENIGANEYKITKTPVDFSLDGGYDNGQVFSVNMKKGETISFSGYGKGIVNARIFQDYNYFETVQSHSFKDLENYEYFNIQRTAAQDCVFCCRFWMNSGDAYVKNIQVEKSSSTAQYIPHTQNTTLIEMPTRLETVKVVRPVMEDGSMTTSNGVDFATTTDVRSNYIPIQPNEHIHIRNKVEDRQANILCYDINKNFIGFMGVNTTCTMPNNCYFVRIFLSKVNCSDLTITRQAYKPIQLNSLPNGVYDEIIMKPNSNKAQLVQRVGKVVLDGSEDWSWHEKWSAGDIICAYTYVGDKQVGAFAYSDKFEGLEAIDALYPQNIETGVAVKECIRYNAGTAVVYVFIKKARLGEPSYNGVKEYLKDNPLTVYYQCNPVTHEIQLKGYPHVYENGTVTLNTDIPHKTLVSYNVNQEQLISNQNETIIRHDQQIDDLYYYIEMYLEEIYQMELFRMKLELSL